MGIAVNLAFTCYQSTFNGHAATTCVSILHAQQEKLRMLLSWTVVPKFRYNEQSAYMIRPTTLQTTQEMKDRLGGKLEVVQASNMGGEQVNNQSNAWLLHCVAPRARQPWLTDTGMEATSKRAFSWES